MKSIRRSNSSKSEAIFLYPPLFRFKERDDVVIVKLRTELVCYLFGKYGVLFQCVEDVVVRRSCEIPCYPGCDLSRANATSTPVGRAKKNQAIC